MTDYEERQKLQLRVKDLEVKVEKLLKIVYKLQKEIDVLEEEHLESPLIKV